MLRYLLLHPGETLANPLSILIALHTSISTLDSDSYYFSNFQFHLSLSSIFQFQSSVP